MANKIQLTISADGSEKTAAEFAKVEASAKRLEQTVRKSFDPEALDRLTNSTVRAATGIDVLSQKVALMGHLTAAIAIAPQVIGSLQATGRALFEASSAAERLKTQLSFSTGNSGLEMAYLTGLTQKLGLEFRSTAQAYSGFAAAARGTSLEGQKTRDVFEAISKASAVMGLSTDQASGALLAIQQMMSKGVVSAEEFRGQLGERMPIALQAGAKALGVTAAEFSKLMESGKIVSEDFLPKFAKAITEMLGDAPEKAAQRLDAAANRMGNAWDTLKQRVGDAGISKAIASDMNALTSTASAMSEAIEQAGRRGEGGFGQVARAAGVLIGRSALGGVASAAESVNGAINLLTGGVLRLSTNISLMPDSLRPSAEALVSIEGKLKSAQVEYEALAQRVAKAPENIYLLSELAQLRQYIAGLKEAREQKALLAGSPGSYGNEGRGATQAKAAADAESAAQQKRAKAYVEMLDKLATPAEKAKKAIQEAKESLGEFFSPEIEKRLRDSLIKSTGIPASVKNNAEESMRARLEEINNGLAEETEAIKLAVAAGEKTQIAGVEAVRAAQRTAHENRIAELNASLARETDSGKRALINAKIQAEVTASLKEGSAAEIDRLRIAKEGLPSLEKQTEAMRLQLEEMGLGQAALIELRAARLEDAAATEAQTAAALRASGAADVEIAAYERKAELLRDQARIARESGIKQAEIDAGKEAAKAAKESAREWEKFSDDINRALTDALMRGFEDGKSFGQNFVDSLKNSLKTSALKIVVEMVTSTGGSLANAAINYVAGTSGSNGGSGTNYFGLASNASSMYNLANGSYLASATNAYNTYAAGTTLGGYTLGYIGAGGSGVTGSVGAGYLGAAYGGSTGVTGSVGAGYLGASYGGTTGVTGAVGGYGSATAGTAGTAGTGAAAGSSYASAMTGVGLIIAGMLMSGDAWKEGYKPNGDLHDTGDIKTSPLVLRDWEYKINKALFGEDWAGGKLFAMLTGSALQIKTVDKWWGGRQTAGKPDLRGSFSTEDAGFSDGMVGTQITEHGGTFTRDKQWWVWEEAAKELENALDGIFVTVSTSLVSAGKALGDESLVEKIKKFSLDIYEPLNDGTLGKLADQLTESMGNILYPSIEALRKSVTVEGKEVAENWGQTFSRVLAEANAVSRVFDMMGMTMAGAFGNDNADKILKLSDAFVQVFGSVDALNASFNSYYENFYTEQEKTAQAWKDMTNAFGQLNQTLPTTREGFRALVDSAAKAGDAGLYKSLLDLQGSFANLVPVIDTQTAAQEALAAAQAQAAEQAKLAAEAAIEAARLSAEAFMRVADEAREAAFGRADSGMATLERAIDLEKQRATAARDAASEQINGIKGLFGLLDDQIAGLVGTTEQALAAQSAAGLSFIEQAAVSARAGYLPDQSQLTNAIGQARAGISGTQYASSFDREFAALKLAGSLSQIREAGAKQLPVAERALSTAESQLKTLDDTLTNTRRQVDELRGINDNTATLGSSIDEMSAAIVGELRTQLSALNGAVLSGLNSGTLSASEASSRLKAGGVETDKFTTIAGQPAFVSSQGAVATASGIATTNGWRGSIDDARKIVAETFASSQPKDFYTAAIQVGLSAAMIDAMYSLPAGTANEWARANNLPAFAQGTNRVPQDMLALIHKDEAIIPAAYNPAAGGSMPTSRLEALVESLTAEVKRLQGQVSEVGNNTRRTADAVNGNPEAPMLVETVV